MCARTPKASACNNAIHSASHVQLTVCARIAIVEGREAGHAGADRCQTNIQACSVGTSNLTDVAHAHRYVPFSHVTGMKHNPGRSPGGGSCHRYRCWGSYIVSMDCLGPQGLHTAHAMSPGSSVHPAYDWRGIHAVSGGPRVNTGMHASYKSEPAAYTRLTYGLIIVSTGNILLQYEF